MSTAFEMLAVMLVSVLCSLLVLRVLSQPLASVLGRACPDAAAAGFWLRYAQLMLTLAPLLVVLLVALPANRTVFEAIRLALLASLFGLLAGLLVVGRVMGKFIALPRP